MRHSGSSSGAGHPYGVLVDVIFDGKGDTHQFWKQWENPAEYRTRDCLRGFARYAAQQANLAMMLD